jgi:transposase
VAQNFIASRREQGFLLPPDVREWLPADHLAWFVIDAVAEMDLSAFYAAYRADGHGRAAYEPAMMVALVLYAFATAQRSSRAIEPHCRQDVAYRVISGNLFPITPRSRASSADTSGRWPSCSATCSGSVIGRGW